MENFDVSVRVMEGEAEADKVAKSAEALIGKKNRKDRWCVDGATYATE